PAEPQGLGAASAPDSPWILSLGVHPLPCTDILPGRWPSLSPRSGPAPDSVGPDFAGRGIPPPGRPPAGLFPRAIRPLPPPATVAFRSVWAATASFPVPPRLRRGGCG